MGFSTKKLVSVFGFLSASCMSFGAYAYEVGTHSEMSAAAYDQSVLNKPDFLKTLGISAIETFDKDRADPRPPKFNDGTARGWIREGSVFEDNLFLGTPFRVRHHFYDPLHRRGLQWGLVSGEKSPDWALEDKQDYAGVSLRQDYSLKDARDYLYKALTAAQEDERKKNFGLTFQTLGHAIHHIQDMAQPQHVRNDVHPSVGAHKSLYEEYTNGVRGTLPVGPYAPVTFREARDFWYNATVHPSAGSGIAEFTNINFLSAGTNFQLATNGKLAPNATYKFPEWNGTTEEVAFWDLLKKEGINCAPHATATATATAAATSTSTSTSTSPRKWWLPAGFVARHFQPGVRRQCHRTGVGSRHGPNGRHGRFNRATGL